MQTFDALDESKADGRNRHSCHRWRRLYGGMKGPEMARMKELEKENARLKKIVAQQAMDIDALKGLSRKTGKPGGQATGGGAFTGGVALHGAERLPIGEAATRDAAIRSTHRLRRAPDSQAAARTGQEASGLRLSADDQAVAERRDEDQQEAGAAAMAGGRAAEPS